MASHLYSIDEKLEFGQELTRAAHSRLGAPFVFHESISSCQPGETLDTCMERGMDERGYDCTGFGIACVADVIGRDACDIAPQLRHVSALSELAGGNIKEDCTELEEGSLVILHVYRRMLMNRWRQTPVHVGVLTHDDWMINAHPGPMKVVKQTMRLKPRQSISVLSGLLLGETGWR